MTNALIRHQLVTSYSVTFISDKSRAQYLIRMKVNDNASHHYCMHIPNNVPYDKKTREASIHTGLKYMSKSMLKPFHEKYTQKESL